jgi:hypothetical protein
MIAENRRYQFWLQNLLLDDSDIILRCGMGGWRAHISQGDFVLYGADADTPSDAVNTLYRSKEMTIDAIERDLKAHPVPHDAGL